MHESTSRSASPLDVVERFGSLWISHDLEAVVSMLTDDFVFESTGPAPDGLRCEGRDAAREIWKQIFDDTESHFQVEQSIEAQDHVIQLWRYSWADGHVRGIDVFRVRGEQVAEKLSYVKG